jgi:hypothetical protein
VDRSQRIAFGITAAVALIGFGFSAAADLSVTRPAIALWVVGGGALLFVVVAALWPERVKLDFKPQPPEPLLGDPNWLKLAVRVTNRKRTGTFQASAITPLSNVPQPNYNVGALAWEGRIEPAVMIPGKGGIFDLYVAAVDQPRRKVRFVGPASVYSHGDQQVGTELDPTAEFIEFVMDVRDTTRDKSAKKRVRIEFDPASNYPTLTVTDPQRGAPWRRVRREADPH